MFDRIIRFSVENRLFVVLAAALLLAWGGWTAAQIPVDVFPDLNRPTVTVMTESGGLSPEEVEALVTRPLEASMNGAPGVERVRSQSAAGLSIVWVEFSWATDIYRARQQVAERLSETTEGLPEGVVPVMGPISSIMGEILLVGLSSPSGELSGPELRTLADWTVRPRLLSIPGIAQVTAIGGGVEQVHVDVDPVALARAGLDLDAVIDGAEHAQGASTGGFVDSQSQELVVRNLARTADPERLADTVIGEVDGVPVSLGSVARVSRGTGVKRGDAGVNGVPAVILAVSKQPGASTVDLTHEVETAVSGLHLDAEVTTLFRQADFIDASIANVEEALRDGAILVTLVLVLFLLNWRTTAITLTAIPLSFVVSALVLHAMGMTVNTMTLGGLAVAIGELVDDAIVDVENVYRRLREKKGLSPSKIVAAASSEVRSSIVFSTILVVLVFVPLFSLSGIEGRLFAPLGVAYITSILASMVVSLTVTPALARWLLPGSAVQAHGDGWLVRQLKGIDRALLLRTLPHPGLVLGATALAVGLAAASVPLLGTSFLPPFNEGTATVNVLSRPGTSLDASNQLGLSAEALLLSVPEVLSVGRRTGRAELDEHAEGVHYSEIDVDFADNGRDREVVLAEIRERLSALPGASVSIGQPISHRLDHLLSGVRAAIAVKVFGQDLGTLRSSAESVRAALSRVPGVVDLAVEPQVLVPQVHVEVDRESALRLGLQPGEVTTQLEAALAGVTVAQVLDGIRPLDLVVRFAPEWRTDFDRLAAAPLLAGDHAIPVGNVATIRRGTGPNQVLHENGQRRIVISANVAERDIGAVVRDIEAVVSRLDLPQGTYATIGGQFESQRQASRAIALLSLVSLVAMYAVLYAHFRSHAITLQVLLNVPLALIGSVAAVWISGQPLSVATLVGFVTLCGISTRNTILMVSHYFHLVEIEGEDFGAAMVIRGSLERLVPVAMTALCAGTALVPLALAEGQPGKEILTPVAQVILGGLVSSTLLDIVVTPTAFLRFGRAAVLARTQAITES